MSYLVLRNKIYHIYYYDRLSQKIKSFSTRAKDKATANKILKSFDAKRELNMLPDSFAKKNQMIKLSAALKLFKSQKQNDKTRKAYQTASDHLIASCGDKYVIQYTNIDYFKLLDRFNLLNLSINSRSNYTRHLSSFFNWCVKNEFAKKNIIEKIKSEKKEVEPICAEHLNQIFQNLLERNLMKEYNFVKLLYLTAFRIGELISAHGEDFNIDEEIIFVRNSKGKRIDKIPMLQEIKLHLLEFPPPSGKIFDYKSTNAARIFWYTVNRKLGLNYKIHQLRKTRGTDLANLGVNPYFLQKFMRHSDIKTTLNYYVKIDLTKMKNEIDSKVCNRFAIDFRQA